MNGKIYILNGYNHEKVTFTWSTEFKSLAEIHYTNLVCENLRTQEFDKIELYENYYGKMSLLSKEKITK